MQVIPKPPFTFKDFVKYPIYAVCFILIIYFMYKEFIQKDSLRNENEYLKKEIVQIKEQSKADLEAKNQTLNRKDRVIDSLNGVIVYRTDNSFEELKKMLNIDNSRKSTIIIKPKRK